MNFEKLKLIVSEDSKIADRSVILSIDVMRGLRSRASMAADIMSVFGKENVECLDFITQKLVLVTLVSNTVFPGDNLKMIQYRPPNSGHHQSVFYNIHIIHPIKANVEGLLTGIPHFFSSSQLPLLKETLAEKLPMLKDVTMEYIPWPGTSIMCGDLLVKAITTDLDSSHEALLRQTALPLGQFEGQVTFKVVGLLEKPEESNLPVEKRDGISLHNWCDKM
ncbi:hypothetical protein SK128_006389 [Halocaridina rubra]|uniref:Uncharacterized protein n=1 Tax=Halocaridina rubra TaxID=373956 RepID=A0AAN8WBZ1_HALRR